MRRAVFAVEISSAATELYAELHSKSQVKKHRFERCFIHNTLGVAVIIIYVPNLNSLWVIHGLRRREMRCKM